MKIETGAAEQHPGSGATPLPLDASGLPGVPPPTPIVPGQLSGPTVDARDTTGEWQSQREAVEADVAAAQASGMAAEMDRRQSYGGQILPLGGSYGEQMDLPVVPENAVPPAQSDLYPYSGMEPTPAAAGFYHGDDPMPGV
jgi:hypothetical protein